MITSTKGKWTHKLVPDLKIWMTRKRGQVLYHPTQSLTAHEYFRNYVFRHERSETNTCPICGDENNTAEHAVIMCDAWERWRREVRITLNVNELKAENIIELMLSLNWKKLQRLIERILKMRETEERTRQLAERLG